MRLGLLAMEMPNEIEVAQKCPLNSIMVSSHFFFFFPHIFKCDFSHIFLIQLLLKYTSVTR